MTPSQAPTPICIPHPVWFSELMEIRRYRNDLHWLGTFYHVLIYVPLNNRVHITDDETHWQRTEQRWQFILSTLGDCCYLRFGLFGPLVHLCSRLLVL